MELKDFGLTPNTNYNGSYLVKKKDEYDHYYSISRTTNKIIFYWDDKGSERRLFLKKVESVKYCGGSERGCEVEEEDTPGGQFDEEALQEEANKETFLFFSENNPFFGNDFTWADMPDFAKDNDLMFQ